MTPLELRRLTNAEAEVRRLRRVIAHRDDVVAGLETETVRLRKLLDDVRDVVEACELYDATDWLAAVDS